MIIKENLYDDIMEFLDDCGGYTDYNQKIEDVMEEFGLSEEEASSYVWTWASGIDKVYEDDEEYDDLDESLNEHEFNNSTNLLDADEREIIETIRGTMKEYVDTFNKRLPRKINNEYVISAGYACGSYYAFYIDYSAIRKLYTKEEAKIALNTFNEFCDILTIYLDVLKFKYPDIEYTIGKTEVSSAKIGKELYVSKFPFKFPNEIYFDGRYI